MNQKISIPPDVIPTTQVEQDQDGNSIVKTFKPLAYSLLCWIKSKGLPDQINLNADSSEAEYSFTMDSHDPSFKYHCFFNLDEGSGLIRYYIYFDDEYFDANDFDVLKLQASINLRLSVGQFQFIETNSGYVLRFYASISVQGIASDDPKYEGPFQIHPVLYDRLFSIGADCMNIYLESFRTSSDTQAVDVEKVFDVDSYFDETDINGLPLRDNSLNNINDVHETSSKNIIKINELNDLYNPNANGPGTDSQAIPTHFCQVADSKVILIRRGSIRNAEINNMYFLLAEDVNHPRHDGNQRITVKCFWYYWKPKTTWMGILLNEGEYELIDNFTGDVVVNFGRQPSK
jgi:hypothetical protein